MRIRPLFIAILLIVALLAGVMAAQARACETKRCAERVNKRAAHAKWRKAVRDYGPWRLRARMRCESGNHGGYQLATTGNGYWYAHQLNVQAWTGAGGRMRHGRPVGVWSLMPERIEQDVRAVYWDRIHGGDPWPNCP